MPRTIIVGDIHGCIVELEALLEEVSFGPDDRLVSVGDLVGKGPAGHEVVRFFRVDGHAAVCGNHDEKLLAFRRGERELGPSHRPDAERLSEADWAWLGARPFFLRLEAHAVIVVHGGALPGVPLEEQDPDLLMNLRSIRADGSGSPRIEDGSPWAKSWPGPERIVFGHDAVRGLQRWPHAIGLDTGCVYGGALTALVLPERELVSVPAASDYAELRA